MRFVIFGAGAIGGAVGARLHQAGHAVCLIARGAHLQAIRRDGLTLLTPAERAVLPLDVAADPAGVEWTGEDVVLLATKSQDTRWRPWARCATPPAAGVRLSSASRTAWRTSEWPCVI